MLTPWTEQEYYPNGKLRREKEYDWSGKNTTITAYNRLGEKTSVRTNETFDENGNALTYTVQYPMREGRYAEAHYTAEYDAAGNRTSLLRVYADGVTAYYMTYEFDQQGNVIRDTEYDEPGGKKLNETTYEYNAEGKLTESRTNDEINGYTTHTIQQYNGENADYETMYYYDGSFCYASLTRYDDDGRAYAYTGFNENGEITYSELDEYNEDGQLIRSKSLNQKGIMTGETLYNDKGNTERRNDYEYADGTYEGYSLYEYDGHGHHIKTTSFDAEGKLTGWCEYGYDGNGDQIRSTDYDENGRVTETTEYTHNRKGRTVLQITANADGTVVSRYEYDDYGVMVFSRRWRESGVLWYETEYGTYGARVKLTDYNSDGSIDDVTSYSGQQERRIRRDCYKDGKIEYYYLYEYDNAGKEKGYSKYLADGTFEGRTEY